MLEDLSGFQFAEWMAYYAIEPFGESRADLRNALLCQITATAFGKKGKRVNLSDFMLFEGPAQKEKGDAASRRAGVAGVRNMLEGLAAKSSAMEKGNK